jgi:hypothetical protein
MFQRSKSSPRKVWFTALASLAICCGSSHAQDFTTLVGNSDPLGLGSFIPEDGDLDLGLSGGIKGQFGYSLKMESDYNSNFFLSETNDKSELSMRLLPAVRYVSDPEGGANFSITADYRPVLRSYLHNDDLNGFDQNGEVVMNFLGTKTFITLFSEFRELSGTDRLTGDFVEGSLITSGFRGARQIAPRTIINAGWSAAISDFSGSTNQGAEIYTTYLGGLWDATERISLGSTLRYTVSKSDNTDTLDAWALLMEGRYKLGERIWFSCSLGPQFTDSGSSNGNSLGLTGDLTAKYVISDLWTWMGSFRSVSVPSPNETNYVVNDFWFSTSIQRQLLRATLSTGLEYRISQFEDVGTVAANRGDENNFTLFTTYSRPVFSERLRMDTMLRYAVNDGLVDWKQILLYLGLETRF